MREVYLLWIEGEIKVFNDFDDAVIEYVKSEKKERAIIKIRANENILYSYDNYERYINTPLVINPATIWKRAYEIKNR